MSSKGGGQGVQGSGEEGSGLGMGQGGLERPGKGIEDGPCGLEGPRLGGLGVGHEGLELPGLGIGGWVCAVGGACVWFEHERPAKIPNTQKNTKMCEEPTKIYTHLFTLDIPIYTDKYKAATQQEWARP